MWRSDAAASTTELQAALCTVVIVAPKLFSLRPFLASFKENLPVRAGDSPSALAVMKGVMPMIFVLDFVEREK